MKQLKLYFQVLLAALCAPFIRACDRADIVLSNALATMYPEGNKSYLTDAAIATANFCVKVGSDENHIAASGAVTDIPLGMCPDTASAAEKNVSIYLFGVHEGTMIGIANAAITNGDMLTTAGNGKLQTLGITNTYYIIGRALATVAAGAEVPFAHCFPTQRIVA